MTDLLAQARKAKILSTKSEARNKLEAQNSKTSF